MGFSWKFFHYNVLQQQQLVLCSIVKALLRREADRDINYVVWCGRPAVDWEFSYGTIPAVPVVSCIAVNGVFGEPASGGVSDLGQRQHRQATVGRLHCALVHT